MFRNLVYVCGNSSREEVCGAAAADLARRMGARLTVVRESGARERAAEAMRLAEQNGCDLIVVADDRSRLPAWIAPSAAGLLLDSAPCPVWMLRGGHVLGTVLCAVDHTATAVGTVRLANGLASKLGAGLVLVHAVPWVDDSTIAYMRDDEPPILSVPEARRHLTMLASSAGAEAEVMAAMGEPRHVIDQAVRKTGAGVVVLGRSGRLARRLATHVGVVVPPRVVAARPLVGDTHELPSHIDAVTHAR